MRPSAITLAIALAACAPAVRAPPIASGPATTTSSAIPTVSWGDDGQIGIAGLPAVARDGSLVVFAHQDADGGRGNPNLTLVAKDRRDGVVKRLVVLTVQDSEALGDSPGIIRARFEAANRWLAELDLARHLSPLAPLAVTADPEGARRTALGDRVAVSWVPSTVRVQLDGLVVTEQPTPTTWLAPDHPLYAGAIETCHNEAFLEAAAIDRERAIAVVTISYMGTDTCWEPSSQAHVISW